MLARGEGGGVLDLFSSIFFSRFRLKYYLKTSLNAKQHKQLNNNCFIVCISYTFCVWCHSFVFGFVTVWDRKTVI